MILIIGGFAQGKLHYVKQSYARCEDGRKVAVLDGTLELPAETGALQVIICTTLSGSSCDREPLRRQ